MPSALGAQLTTLRTGRSHRGLASGRTEPGALLGLEHEYRVFGETGPVDFGRLLHGLRVRGLRLDPSDPNAYRCEWGGALTCDGPEAEVASPPVPVAPGFAGTLDGWARLGQGELRATIGSALSLEGYSTHLNVALPTKFGDRVARIYAHHFAPAAMLLTGHAGTPGLLVRPRPSRLELGTEFVAGQHLRAGAAFAVGSVIASARAAATPFDRRVRGSLPPRLRVRTQPAVERYGVYVDRAAFGGDLFRDGRETRLRRVSGAGITAQEHLEAAWESARRALDGCAAPEDLHAAELMVAARLPLPVEAGTETLPEPTERLCSPLGGALAPRSRPGFDARAVLATWTFTVFELEGSSGSARTTYCCIPLDTLGDFLDQLDAGILDRDIRAFLAAAPQGRVLASVEQTDEPGLYDELGPPRGLLPSERDPANGRPIRANGGGTGPGRGRPGKRESRARPWRRGRVGAVVAAVVVVLLAVAAVALSQGGGDSTNVAAPPQTRAVPTTTPTVPPSTSPATSGTRTFTVQATITDVSGPAELLDQFRAENLGTTQTWSLGLIGPCTGGQCSVLAVGGLFSLAIYSGTYQLTPTSTGYHAERPVVFPNQTCNAGTMIGDQSWTLIMDLTVSRDLKSLSGTVQTVPAIDQADGTNGGTCYLYRSVFTFSAP